MRGALVAVVDFAGCRDTISQRGFKTALGLGHCAAADCPIDWVRYTSVWRAQLADAQPAAQHVLTGVPEAWSAQVVDLDGDGTDDVLLANSAGDSGIQ
jgi:hypothetical protein